MALTFELASFGSLPKRGCAGEAEDAAKRIEDVPETRAWFRHIAASHGLRHVEVLHAEPFEPW